MSDPQALHVTRNVIPGKLGVDLHLHRVHIPLVKLVMLNIRMRMAQLVQKLQGVPIQNVEIGSRDAGHAHLEVALWSVRRRGPSSMSVPYLKRICQFVQKL